MLVAEIKRVGLSLNEHRHTVAQARFGEELAAKPNWNGNMKAVIAADADQAVTRLGEQAREYLKHRLEDLDLQPQDLWFEIGFGEVEEATGFFWQSLTASYAARYRLSDAQPLRRY